MKKRKFSIGTLIVLSLIVVSLIAMFASGQGIDLIKSASDLGNQGIEKYKSLWPNLSNRWDKIYSENKQVPTPTTNEEE